MGFILSSIIISRLLLLFYVKISLVSIYFFIIWGLGLLLVFYWINELIELLDSSLSYLSSLGDLKGDYSYLNSGILIVLWVKVVLNWFLSLFLALTLLPKDCYDSLALELEIAHYDLFLNVSLGDFFSLTNPKSI